MECGQEVRMDKNERKDRTRGQVRLLQEFYKTLQTWEVSSVGAWLGAGILLSVGTALFWIPSQEYGGDSPDQMMYVLMTYLLWIGLVLYMNPYTTITEERKRKSIMSKLQYLPVSRRSILLFQLKKLFRMVLLLGTVQLVGQCAVTAIAYRRLELRNLLFPILLGMLVPGVMSGLIVVTSVMCAKTSKS